MAELTVAKLAESVGTPVEKLLEQLKDAGIAVKGETSTITGMAESECLRMRTGSMSSGRRRPARSTPSRTSR